MKKKRKKPVFLTDEQIESAYLKWRKGAYTVIDLARELNTTTDVLSDKFSKVMSSEKNLRKDQREILEEYGYKTSSKPTLANERSYVRAQRSKAILDFVRKPSNNDV